MKYLYLRVIQDPRVAKRNKTGVVVSRYTKPTKNISDFPINWLKNFTTTTFLDCHRLYLLTRWNFNLYPYTFQRRFFRNLENCSVWYANRNAYGDKLRHYIFTLARFDGKWHILAETSFILTPIHPAKQTTKSHVLLYLPQSSKGYPSHALSRFLITFASAFRKKIISCPVFEVYN